MSEGLLKFVTAQAYECLAGILIGIYVPPDTYANIGFQVRARTLSHRPGHFSAFLAVLLNNGGIDTASHLGLIATRQQSSLEISTAFSTTGDGTAQKSLSARFHGG
jgi:hypothetical protein